MNPKPCSEEMQVRLSRFVDGELPDEERTQVSDHLAECEPCRELLALFQKNENLLSNSLTTDAFGEAVIASVVTQLKGEAPPEARPVEEGIWDWVRTRPLVQLAAAALLVVGLMAILSASHADQMGELSKKLNELQETLDRTETAYQDTLRTHQIESDQIAESFARYDRLVRELRVDKAAGRLSDRTALAYIEPNDHRLVVKAAFSQEDYVGFHVYRAEAAALKKDRDKAYRLLTEIDDPLQVPLFMDMTAKPGKVYVYRFRALRRKGDPVDSVPIQMRLPHAGDLSPEKSIRVLCELIGKDRDQAKFRLERLVDGRRISRVFYVKLHEPVGGKVKVREVGEVDFSTGLVLSALRPGTQTLSIRITEPVLDSAGNPVIYEFGPQGIVVPATKDRDWNVLTNPNMFAELKPSESADTRTVPVWRGSSIRVPAP